MSATTARIKTRRLRRSNWRSLWPTGQSNPWLAFLFVFVSSVALAVFVLFMQRQWRQSGQRAVLIVHNDIDEVRKPLTIAVIDPAEPKLTLLPLSPENPISTLLDYGEYQSQALVGLTQLENLRWEFLTNTLSLEYGVAIDGIIWTRAPQVRNRSQLRSVALSGVTNRADTTLTYWDRWRWLLMIQSLPDYKVDISFADGQDLDARENWTSRMIYDPVIRGAGVSVSIQNGSGKQGLATKFGRMLRVMGYDVRNLETVEPVSQSSFYFRPDLKHDSAGRWAIIRLVTAAVFLKPEPNEETTQRQRSDFVIILGQDLREKFTLGQNLR